MNWLENYRFRSNQQPGIWGTTDASKLMGCEYWFSFGRAQEEDMPGTIQADKKNVAKIFSILLKTQCGLVWEYKNPGDHRYKGILHQFTGILICLCGDTYEKDWVGDQRKPLSVEQTWEKERPPLWERHKLFGSYVPREQKALSLSGKVSKSCYL